MTARPRTPSSAGTRAPSLGYHPGFDGLRGAAIALVLLFHAEVTGFDGGFIGVDVFFVLSGFLITRLLLDERYATGAIGLGRFYLRRALRLLPALAVVMAACLVYSAGWLDVTQQGRLRHDIVATATYHMNWKLALTERPPFGFFDHAWSLGIEEQFYLAWPAVIALVAASRWRARGVLVAAAIGAAASTLLRFGLSLHDTPMRRIYYGTDTHADGLLIGAALAAVTVLLARRDRLLKAPAVTGPTAVFTLLVAATTFVNGTASVDRLGLTVVALASALLIADVLNAGPADRLLSWPPLVALGRISYGLYLWHWPVYLVVNGDRFDVGAPLLFALRLGASVTLAALSYRFVEQPFLRRKSKLSIRSGAGGGDGAGDHEYPTTSPATSPRR